MPLTYTAVHFLYKCCHKKTQKLEAFVTVYDFGSNSQLKEDPFSREKASCRIKKQSY